MFSTVVPVKTAFAGLVETGKALGRYQSMLSAKHTVKGLVKEPSRTRESLRDESRSVAEGFVDPGFLFQ